MTTWRDGRSGARIFELRGDRVGEPVPSVRAIVVVARLHFRTVRGIAVRHAVLGAMPRLEVGRRRRIDFIVREVRVPALLAVRVEERGLLVGGRDQDEDGEHDDEDREPCESRGFRDEADLPTSAWGPTAHGERGVSRASSGR